MKELCIFAGCVYFRITVFPFNAFSFFPTKIIYGNATWFLGSNFTSDGLEKKNAEFYLHSNKGKCGFYYYHFYYELCFNLA